MKHLLCFIVMPLALAWGPGTALPAQGGEKVTITMKVTSGGLITTDIPIVDKKIFLPRLLKGELLIASSPSGAA